MGKSEIKEAIASIREKLDGVHVEAERLRHEIDAGRRRLARLDEAIEALEDVHVPGPNTPGPDRATEKKKAPSKEEKAEEAKNTNRPRKSDGKGKRSSLRNMTVKDLRDELASRGLPIEGTKAELVERLVDAA